MDSARVFDPCHIFYWRRKWQPILVFLPGKSRGQRNPGSYSPCGCKELDMINHACVLQFKKSLEDSTFSVSKAKPLPRYVQGRTILILILKHSPRSHFEFESQRFLFFEVLLFPGDSFLHISSPLHTDTISTAVPEARLI